MFSRHAFTAIEISVCVAIIATLVSTSVIVTAPVLGRAAFNLSAERLADAARQAQHLARASQDTTAFYGLVLRQENGRLVAMVTHGTNAISANELLLPDGQPRVRVDLGTLRFHSGSSANTATVLGDGQEVGWLYRSDSGYPAVTSALSLAPVYLGVTQADLTAAGIIGGQIHLGQHCSLRTSDGTRATAISIYATGEVVLQSDPL